MSPVQAAAAARRAEGAPAVEMGSDHVSFTGSYRPPVLVSADPTLPPQTIMALPVQTVDWSNRGLGAEAVEMDDHVLFTGSYRPPPAASPQMTTLDPVHTAEPPP